MEKQLSVARKLNELYKAEHDNKDMDELRMHKLMYFVQRESLIKKNVPMFRGNFKAWKYGPVLDQVRTEMKSGKMFADARDDLSEESAALITEVYQRYQDRSSIGLNKMSHLEFSWQNSRVGLQAQDRGKEAISLDAMRVDAVREKIHRALEGNKE